MNPRLTLGLLVVLAVLGGLLLFIDRRPESPPARDAERLPEVMSFSLADAQRLELRRADLARQFRRGEDGQWVLEPGGQRAHQNAVESLLARLSALRATRRIPPTNTDLSAYGLISPRLTALVGLRDDTIHELRIGEKTPVETGYYAVTAQGGDVYVVPSILVDEMERLIAQPFAPTPTPAPPTPTPTFGPTAPPIGAPTLTPAPTSTPAPAPRR